MKEDLTSQELSKEEKLRLAEKRCYEKNKEKRLEKARARYLKNKEKLKKYHESNREKRLVKMKVYHVQNREKRLQQMREYRRDNADYFKEYYRKNKDATKLYDKMYFIKNKKRINKRLRKKYKENAQYKMQCILRHRFSVCLRRCNVRKNIKMLELTGLDINSVKRYIESLWLPGMTWDNHGNYGWHIDHIRPVNTFDLTDIKQQKICFHYTNLRPLWATDNLSRPDDGSDII
jgi:hypothetical protein